QLWDTRYAVEPLSSHTPINTNANGLDRNHAMNVMAGGRPLDQGRGGGRGRGRGHAWGRMKHKKGRWKERVGGGGTVAWEGSSTTTGRHYGISSVHASDDGSHIAVCTVKSQVTVYRYHSGSLQLTGHYTGNGNTSSFYVRAKLSPDGTLLASGSTTNAVCIWEVARPGPPMARLLGHINEVNGLDWCSAEPLKLASCSDDETVRVWSLGQGRSTCNPAPTPAARSASNSPVFRRLRTRMAPTGEGGDLDSSSESQRRQVRQTQDSRPWDGYTYSPNPSSNTARSIESMMEHVPGNRLYGSGYVGLGAGGGNREDREEGDGEGEERFVGRKFGPGRACPGESDRWVRGPQRRAPVQVGSALGQGGRAPVATRQREGWRGDLVQRPGRAGGKEVSPEARAHGGSGQSQRREAGLGGLGITTQGPPQGFGGIPAGSSSSPGHVSGSGEGTAGESGVTGGGSTANDSGGSSTGSPTSEPLRSGMSGGKGIGNQLPDSVTPGASPKRSCLSPVRYHFEVNGEGNSQNPSWRGERGPVGVDMDVDAGAEEDGVELGAVENSENVVGGSRENPRRKCERYAATSGKCEHYAATSGGGRRRASAGNKDGKPVKGSYKNALEAGNREVDDQPWVLAHDDPSVQEDINTDIMAENGTNDPPDGDVDAAPGLKAGSGGLSPPPPSLLPPLHSSTQPNRGVTEDKKETMLQWQGHAEGEMYGPEGVALELGIENSYAGVRQQVGQEGESPPPASAQDRSPGSRPGMLKQQRLAAFWSD
ncbi:unnamed protein product, partial [Discosporangium mesarthrocarpum]